MNNSKKCKILLETRNMVYGEYPNIREFIDISMPDICRSKNVSPHLVLFYLLCFSLIFSLS